jgi:hypothetical protein
MKDKQYKDRDWLYRYYITWKYSAIDIAYLVDCHPSTIYYWLKKHGIPVRSPSEARALEAKIRRKASDISERLDHAVGRFALSFERLCHSLRIGICTVLELHGLQNAWKITDIMVGDVTAFPLQSIFRALIVETHELSEEESKIITSIFKRVARLTEERNRIIHSAWYVDYKSRQDLLSDTLVRLRPGYSKHGAKPSPTKHPLAEIEEWTDEARELEELVTCLYHRFNRGHRIKDYFEIGADGEVQARPLEWPGLAKRFLARFSSLEDAPLSEQVLEALRKLPRTGRIRDTVPKAISWIIDEIPDSEPRKDEINQLFQDALSRARLEDEP